MKRIASRDNPFFKTLRRRVADAGTRRDAGLVVLEGVHLCDAFLAAGGAPRQVVVGTGALDRPEVAALLARAPDAEHFVVDDALFAAVSRLAHGVAVLMVIERPAPPGPAGGTAVLLDRVQDPGNVGSILRSAAAAGVASVHLTAGCAGAWSPKVVRAAMGAHFVLAVHDEADGRALRDGARPWIATSPHAARALHEVDLAGDVVWVFGHEGQGVAAPLLDGATAVRIPQPGSVESLNVAAAAAVCLFEQVRQRTVRPGPSAPGP